MIDRIVTSRIATALLTALLTAITVLSWYLEDAFGTSIVLALTSWSILLVASARQKATGRHHLLPRSPLDWTLAALLTLLFLAVHAASFALVASGRPEWCFAIAAIAFVVFAVGFWLDDRIGHPASAPPTP